VEWVIGFITAYINLSKKEYGFKDKCFTIKKGKQLRS